MEAAMEIPIPEADTVADATRRAFEEMLSRVMLTAINAGFSDNAVRYVERVREATTRIVALQARISYELSGSRLMQEALVARGMEVFGNTDAALDLFRRIRTAGIHGQLDDWLKSSSNIRPGDTSILTRQARMLAQSRRAERVSRAEAAFERNIAAGRSPRQARAAAERARDWVPDPEDVTTLGQPKPRADAAFERAYGTPVGPAPSPFATDAQRAPAGFLSAERMEETNRATQELIERGGNRLQEAARDAGTTAGDVLNLKFSGA